MSNFTIMNVVNQSVDITKAHIGRVFAVSIGVALAMIIGISLIAGLLGLLATFLGDFISIIGFLVIFLLALAGMGALFNYWVRLGALGVVEAGEGSWKEVLKAGLVNGFKFILITILLALAVVVLMFVFKVLGVDLPQAASMDMTAAQSGDFSSLIQMMNDNMAQSMSAQSLAYNLSATVLVCFIYAFFSANLTTTALREKAVSYETPQAVDFATALIILYLIMIIPSYLLIWAELYTASVILQVVVGIPVGAAIGIAHGVRHRLCVDQSADVA